MHIRTYVCVTVCLAVSGLRRRSFFDFYCFSFIVFFFFSVCWYLRFVVYASFTLCCIATPPRLCPRSLFRFTYFAVLFFCGLRRVGNCNWNLALKRVNDLLSSTLSLSFSLCLSCALPLAVFGMYFFYSCRFLAKLFWRLFCRFVSCLLVWVMVVLPRHGYMHTHSHTLAHSPSLAYVCVTDCSFLASALSTARRDVSSVGLLSSLDSGFAPCYDCSFVAHKLNNIVAVAFHAIKS